MGYLVCLMGDYSTGSYNSYQKIFSKDYIFLVLISINSLYAPIFHYANHAST